MCICDRAAYSAGKEFDVKKIFVFFLAVAALLCFAMPAIASPPGGLPVLEALGPVAAYAAPAISLERAPIIAAAPNVESATTFESVSALETSIATLLIIATVATLAGLMYGAAKSGIAKSYYVGRTQGIASFSAGSRKWV